LEAEFSALSVPTLHSEDSRRLELTVSSRYIVTTSEQTEAFMGAVVIVIISVQISETELLVIKVVPLIN
jgi:hypothetical protein